MSEQETKLEDLYKVDPQVLNTLLNNQTVQLLKQILALEQSKTDIGDQNYIRFALTTTLQQIPIDGVWKRLSVTNIGTVTVNITVYTYFKNPASDRVTEIYKTVDLDADEVLEMSYNQDKIFKIVGQTQTGTSTVKVILTR